MKKRIAVCMAKLEESIQTDSVAALLKLGEQYEYGIQILNSFEELVVGDLYDKGEKSIFDLLDADFVDGVILFSETIKDEATNEKIMEYCRSHGLPFVCIDRDVVDAYSITFGYKESFKQIVEHMIVEHGCKDIFMMAGMRNNAFSEERIDAVREVMAKYGLTLKPQNIGYGDFWDAPCRAVIKNFLASGRPLPDVFISANDTMAITIVAELTNAGYRVPDDVFVTGFDGIELEKHTLPRLTTAQQDLASGMKAALDILDRLIHGEEVENKVIEIPFAVRYAQSCGCQGIPVSTATSQLMNLYNDLSQMRLFFKYNFELQVAMSAEKNMLTMIRHLPEKLFLLEGCRYVSVIVEPKVFENDDTIMRMLAERGQSGCIKNKDKLIQFAEYYAGLEFTTPLQVFDRKDILPDYDGVEAKYHQLCMVPLHVQDYVIGYFVFEYNEHLSRRYPMNYMARTISFCIDDMRKDQRTIKANEKLKQTNEKLEELYIRDPLTNIYNRRGFFTELKAQLKKRKGGICMISIDLDRLKYINDVFGHSEGDFAIQAIAKALENSIGELGIYARFGGDEFTAALFDETDIIVAQEQWRERFAACINQLNLASGKSYPIGASCGVACGVISEGMNVDQMLNEADENMYDIKRERHKTSRARDESRR